MTESIDYIINNFIDLMCLSMMEEDRPGIILGFNNVNGSPMSTIDLINYFIKRTNVDGKINPALLKKLIITSRVAYNYSKFDVLSHLINILEDAELISEKGLTLLMESAQNDSIEVGQILVDKGANVNATANTPLMNTALIIATAKGFEEFVEFLLQNEASVDKKNAKGNSPLWIAASTNNLDIIKTLHRYGANLESKNKDNVSCLMAAFLHGHEDVVSWLVDRVSEFPDDEEMNSHINAINESNLLKSVMIRCKNKIQATKNSK